MTNAAARRVLLGPQRPEPNLGEALAAAELRSGQIAVISAGWQEAESDIDDIRALVDRPLADLRLYHRTEEIFAEDPEFASAYRERQNRLIELQRLYRLRLKPLALAARNVLRDQGDPALLHAEQRHAIAQLRALDEHHLQRTESLHREFEEVHGPATNQTLQRHRTEIRELLAKSAGVLVTGGNVVVLLNRMRLFDIAALIAPLPIIAWSAGAMALASRVVLFHDHTPEGRRDPEIFGAGCGLVQGRIFLPDSDRRLRKRNRSRMGTMGRRFATDTCVTLDNGSLLVVEGDKVRHAASVHELGRDGRFIEVRAA